MRLLLALVACLACLAPCPASAQSLPTPTVSNIQVKSSNWNGDVVGMIAARVPNFQSKTALAAAVMPVTSQSVFLSSFGGGGSATFGFARWRRRSDAPSPVQVWNVQSSDGAWWELAEPRPTPQMFGAAGDNSTNDAPAFAAAIAYSQAKGAKLYIPSASYALGSQLVVTVPIGIDSDAAANLRWTNPASCGWNFDMRAAQYGLYEVRLPNLYSPAVNSIFHIPGYSAQEGFTQDPSTRTCTAVRIQAASRMSFRSNYMAGFDRGYSVEATNDATFGSRTVDNIDVDVNTVDFTTSAFFFDGGPVGSGGVHAIRASANTVWAKFPLNFAVSSSAVSQGTFTIGGQTFINEPGGAGVYAMGSNLNTSSIEINWLYAGKGLDSAAGTPASLSVPYIAGNAISNGQSSDGNTSIGYFGGYRNKIVIGAAIDQGQPGNGVPTAGAVIRVRDTGAYNDIQVRYQAQLSVTPIVLSTTRGEVNYNGGVGGASLSKRTYYQVSTRSLGPGASATFYFYNQTLSSFAARPLSVLPADGGLDASGLRASAFDRAALGGANREGTLVITNPTASTVSPQTLYLYVDIPN